MQSTSGAHRGLPLLGTAIVLGIGAWQLGTAGLPATVGAAELALVLVAAATALLSLSHRMRLDSLTPPNLIALLQGLSSVAVATAILGTAAPWLRNPVALIVTAFMAVLLSMNPQAPRRVLAVNASAALTGAAVVWWRAGLLAGGGPGPLVATEGLMLGTCLLAYTNWSLTNRRSVQQTGRLAAMATTARRLGVARNMLEIAEAALGGCKEAYPDITWGGVMLLDAGHGALVTLPAYLGPEGFESTPEHGRLRLKPGEGIAGSVAASGRPVLLRTQREVAAAYGNNLQRDRLMEVERWGGGRRVRSFLAVPLRSPFGETVGVLILNSHRRDDLWDATDVLTVQAIADETAVAIERSRLFDEQQRHALTDPLTQVANRRAFEARLQQETAGPWAMLAIDVDHLKEVNDEYGHEAGDMLLVEVARILRAHVRASDLVARTGGDEFVAILQAVTQPEAASIAERMRTSLHGVALPHGRARISVGVAATSVPMPIRKLWLAADAALSQAKRSGRDRVRLAPASVGAWIAEQHDATALLESVLRGERRIDVALQPIVSLSSRHIDAYEALARFPGWHARGDSVDEIFEAARRRGSMRDLDWACRRAAVTCLRRLESDTALFINVSTAMLLDPLHPVDHMLLLLRHAGRDPDGVVLEISEREPIPDTYRLQLVLSSYREHGIRFALDDVGEGHSTLELLAIAVPEYVKLARSITQHCDRRGPRAVVEAAVAFAASVGASVVAEGIEEEQTRVLMQSLGVSHGQGYLLGPPALVRPRAAQRLSA